MAGFVQNQSGYVYPDQGESSNIGGMGMQMAHNVQSNIMQAGQQGVMQGQQQHIFVMAMLPQAQQQAQMPEQLPDQCQHTNWVVMAPGPPQVSHEQQPSASSPASAARTPGAPGRKVFKIVNPRTHESIQAGNEGHAPASAAPGRTGQDMGSIVCGGRAPSIRTRQRAMRSLRVHLDGLAAPELDTPVVRIIVGDNNLNAQHAREAVQQHTDDEALWEVFASPADRIGDNVAVCGAVAKFRPIAVGASYMDRGMRTDSRDAVAVVLTLRGASQPAERGTRSRSRSPSRSPCVWSRSPSPTPTARAQADGEAIDDPEDEISQRAQALHSEMREYWNQRYDEDYDQKLLHHLSRLLFKKRKSAQPAEGGRRREGGGGGGGGGGGAAAAKAGGRRREGGGKAAAGVTLSQMLWSGLHYDASVYDIYKAGRGEGEGWGN